MTLLDIRTTVRPVECSLSPGTQKFNLRSVHPWEKDRTWF